MSSGCLPEIAEYLAKELALRDLDLASITIVLDLDSKEKWLPRSVASNSDEISDFAIWRQLAWPI